MKLTPIPPPHYEVWPMDHERIGIPWKPARNASPRPILSFTKAEFAF